MAQSMEAAHRNTQVLQRSNEPVISGSCGSASNLVAQMEKEEIDRIGRYSRPLGAGGPRKNVTDAVEMIIWHTIVFIKIWYAIIARNLDTWQRCVMQKEPVTKQNPAYEADTMAGTDT